MKIYLLADLEGATGVTGGWKDINPGKRLFDYAKKMLTEDVNACTHGAFEAGADEIHVFDGHGTCFSLDNINLDPRLKTIQGNAYNAAGFVPGLDESFDAMIIVGMHAMEGTADGIMNSTMSSPARFWINGKEMGETGLFSAIAAQLGIPLIMITGDEAVAREAKDLIPEVYTVAVKKGLTRYSGIVRDANKVWEEIYEVSKEAVKNYKKMSLMKIEKPVEVIMEYPGNTQVVDVLASLPGVKRINGFTVSYTSDSIEDSLLVLTCFSGFQDIPAYE